MTGPAGPVCRAWEPFTPGLCPHNSCWDIMTTGDSGPGGWWLNTLGINAMRSPEDVAAQLASYDGPSHYQARAHLPGGRVIVTGIHGARADWARADLAGLFRTRPSQWTVTRIRHPASRTAEGRAQLRQRRDRKRAAATTEPKGGTKS
jgi:hypothetical protein